MYCTCSLIPKIPNTTGSINGSDKTKLTEKGHNMYRYSNRLPSFNARLQNQNPFSAMTDLFLALYVYIF